MRVSIFGLGHVGCVTGVCLAKAGHQVIGVDINPDKVAMVNGGISPLVEPGLGELLAGVTATGRLRATTSTEEGVSRSDMALIRDNGQLDVDAIRRVAEGIGRGLRQHPKPYTVGLWSTVLSTRRCSSSPNADEQARQALAAARPHHLVIDLGRGGVQR